MTESTKNTTTETKIDESNVSLTRRLRRMKRRLLFEHVLENDDLQDFQDNTKTMDEEEEDDEDDDDPISSTTKPVETALSKTTGSRRRGEKLGNLFPIHRVNKLFWRGHTSNLFQMARQRD